MLFCGRLEYIELRCGFALKELVKLCMAINLVVVPYKAQKEDKNI